MKKVLVLLLICLSSTAMFAEHWQYNAGNGTPMTMTGLLYINGQEVFEEALNYEIGFFDVDGVCRAAKLPKLKNGHYRYSPTIHGLPENAGTAYTCRIWDHVNNCELECTFVPDAEDPLIYTPGKKWGSSSAPYGLTFTVGGGAQTFTKEIVGYASTTGNGSNWYLIASPIGEVAPGDVDGLIQDVTEETDYDLFWFDQTQNGEEWRNNKAAAIQELVPGMGYLYASKQNTTLTFTGTPIEGDSYEVSLVYDESSNFPGWNLIGNPFAEDGADLGGRPYYVMNAEGTDFIAYNTNRGAPNDGELIGYSDLQPMEGAFVIAEEDGDTLTITKGGDEAWEEKNLTLNLTQGRGIVDRAVIRFDEGRTLPKLQLNPNHTKVYIPQDGNDYAVVRAGNMGEMPVSFKAENNGTYTMSFTSEEVSFNYLHLIDNLTGADVDLLATPSYSFDALTTDYASRFRLVFATGNNSDNDSFAFFSNGNLVINNDGDATVQVVDVTGRILSSETINGSASINVNGAAGVYMIRLINGENVKVQKVVVK